MISFPRDRGQLEPRTVEVAEGEDPVELLEKGTRRCVCAYLIHCSACVRVWTTKAISCFSCVFVYAQSMHELCTLPDHIII